MIEVTSSCQFGVLPRARYMPDRFGDPRAFARNIDRLSQPMRLEAVLLAAERGALSAKAAARLEAAAPLAQRHGLFVDSMTGETEVFLSDVGGSPKRRSAAVPGVSRHRVLRLLRDCCERGVVMTQGAFSARLSLSPSSVQSHVAALIADGLIVRDGDGGGRDGAWMKHIRVTGDGHAAIALSGVAAK